MIRFILKHKISDENINLQTSNFETIDIDAPELERLIKRGGRGLSGYDLTELAGIEIID